MARPRIHHPETVGSVDTYRPWREFVDPGDVEAVAARFRRAARRSPNPNAPSQVLPEPLDDPAADIDAVESALGESPTGRRDFAWMIVYPPR